MRAQKQMCQVRNTRMTTSLSPDEWLDFRQQLEHLKDMIDPRYLLEALGFSIGRETAKEIRSTCSIHGGDNKTAFRFNKETRSWVCFTNRCHERYGSDIISLIRSVNDVSFMDAVKYLKNLTGGFGEDYDIIEYKRKKEREEFVRTHKKKTEGSSSIVKDEILREFKPFRSNYFLKHGFKSETLDFFEIAGGYTDSYGYVRDIIPIRNDEGTLLAYSLRDIRDNVDYDIKYMFTYGFNKDSVLYNFHNAKDCTNDKPLILVEGYKSVWRLHEYGIHKVAAVMGSEVTDGQINLICSYDINDVVIMFDNDKAGITGCVKSCEKFGSRINTIPVFITEVKGGKGLDPSDLSKEGLLNYLDSYI